MIQSRQKSKKPYILNLKHHKTQQTQKVHKNDLYEQLKKEYQNSKRFKTLQDNKEFYIKLDQVIQRQPSKVIGKQLSVVQARRQLQKRRKKLQKAALQPKKSYENYTECLFHRLPKKRTQSQLLGQDNRKSKGLSKSSTGFVRSITNHSLVRKNITTSVQQESNNIKSHLPTSSSHSSCPKNQLNNQKQSQQYNKAFYVLIKGTKSYSSSIYKQEKRLNTMSQLHDKMYKHFDKLAIGQKELENIQFDDISAITKVQRYKFNTNNFLQNILLKKDSAAKDWIEKENKKQFRKNTIQIVKQKLTDNVLKSKCIKFHKKQTQLSKQIVNRKQQFTKTVTKFKPVQWQKTKYQQPKRIKDILYIKAKY